MQDPTKARNHYDKKDPLALPFHHKQLGVVIKMSKSLKIFSQWSQVALECLKSRGAGGMVPS